MSADARRKRVSEKLGEVTPTEAGFILSYLTGLLSDDDRFMDAVEQRLDEVKALRVPR
jgi:hypothetical protein